jgi:hypothetical protein
MHFITKLDEKRTGPYPAKAKSWRDSEADEDEDA